jgi:sensor histidine kinase YesM
MLSISAWNIVFNPGVESTAAIKGLQDYWAELLMLDFLFLLYCLLPFVWCLKNVRKWLKILATLLFIVPTVYLIFEFLQPEESREDLSLFTDLFLSGFLYVLVFHLTIAAAVYYNLRILVTRYLKESRFGIYLLLVSGLVVAAALVNFALFDYVIDKLFLTLYFISYYNIWELQVIVGAYVVFSTVLYLVWQYAAVLIANRDKAQNELSALKAQINPHFLFNNLNTIYSMASRNDENTKEVILQLSDFLRYVLYDTTSEFIPLEKEVDIIRTYVELQKSRIDSDITTVTLELNGDFGNQKIAPLLLLPLAENCFKHGSGKKDGFIRIQIDLMGKELRFTTKNTIVLREKGGAEEYGGIGINNVEKRLNLLYPGRHKLTFEAQDGIFDLEMRVEL